MKITFVLWGGAIGGTERFSLSLAGEMRSRGLDSKIVFVADEGDLRNQLARESLDFVALNLSPGRLVLRHPRKLARAVADTNADIAIIGSFGYLGSALKFGGFRGVVIGVEHGALLTVPALPRKAKIIRRLDRLSGALGHDAEVAVSDFMLHLAEKTFHSRRLVCIKHGVRLSGSPSPMPGISDNLCVGYVGRLIPGKGVDVLLRALGRLHEHPTTPVPLLTIAGDGPGRPELAALARNLGLEEHVRFVGWTDDARAFWAEHHLAVAPSYEFVESFGMTVIEAMAAARPVIVSDRGALPELVEPDVCGAVVDAGSVAALADAIDRYRSAPEALSVHGLAAYERVRDNFTLERCADEYLKLVAAIPST